MRLKLFLLLSLLSVISACDKIGPLNVKRGVVGAGSGSVDSSINFSGITSATDKTDSTVTLHWAAHPDAVSYKVFNVVSGTPVYIMPVMGATSVTLTGLTRSTTYKFRVRMENSAAFTDANEVDVTVVTNAAPDVPNTPTLVIPASSPNFELRPTVNVSGVKAGDIVKIFSDACTTEIGSGTVAVGETDIDIQTTNPLAVQAHTIFAHASNGTNSSACTSSSLAYVILTCPTGYVLVPENTDLNVPNFCVMKYESKAEYMLATVPAGVQPNGDTMGGVIYDPVVNTTGYRPISQESALPWNYINAADAKLACKNLGTNYDIISNPEWMNIARNVEAVAANWSSGAVGVGCLFRGNNDLNDSCGYDGSDPEAGPGRDAKAKLVLSNGEEIWDLAGNYWEWVDWSIGGNPDGSFRPGPTTCPFSWTDFAFVMCTDMTDDDYMPLNPKSPPVPFLSYNSDYGLGRVQLGNGGTVRGGSFNANEIAGAFALGGYFGPGSGNGDIGFRCVYRP